MPSVKFFSWRLLSKNYLWEFLEGSQVLDVMRKTDLIHGTEESIFRKSICFCFLFVPFFCLPELFSFISLPVFPLLKSSLSSNVYEFIAIKPSHTVKIALDYEYRGSVLS